MATTHRIRDDLAPSAAAGTGNPASCPFIEVPQGCEVHLIHGGWAARGARAQESRDAYDGGWVGVLRAYGDASTAVAS
jgi:hypothetical protein